MGVLRVWRPPLPVGVWGQGMGGAECVCGGHRHSVCGCIWGTMNGGAPEQVMGSSPFPHLPPPGIFPVPVSYGQSLSYVSVCFKQTLEVRHG